MGCLDGEALTAMSVLLKQGLMQSAVARLLGITEGRGPLSPPPAR